MSKEEIKSLLIIWETFNNGVDHTIENREELDKKFNDFLDMLDRLINQNKNKDE